MINLFNASSCSITWSQFEAIGPFLRAGVVGLELSDGDAVAGKMAQDGCVEPAAVLLRSLVTSASENEPDVLIQFSSLVSFSEH